VKGLPRAHKIYTIFVYWQGVDISLNVCVCVCTVTDFPPKIKLGGVVFRGGSSAFKAKNLTFL